MSKKVTFGTRPTARETPPAPAGDDWVTNRSEGGAPEPLKRLTFDVPESLHTAMKIDCARRKVKMGHEVLALLEAKWRPKQD
ncbi:MAG: hypothetical protein V4582_16480 [Pseudomonadota bacterium]